jgi:type IV pilus assembly protein PilV
MSSSRARARGVSLIEVLVAVVVISVGMLGIAGLYLASLKASRSANMRVHAVNLVYDMADRIRANKRGRAAYNSAAYTGGRHNCLTATCTPQQTAENDLGDWNDRIAQALMNLGARGTVVYTPPGIDDVHRFEVGLTWREAGENADSSYSVRLEL